MCLTLKASDIYFWKDWPRIGPGYSERGCPSHPSLPATPNTTLTTVATHCKSRLSPSPSHWWLGNKFILDYAFGEKLNPACSPNSLWLWYNHIFGLSPFPFSSPFFVITHPNPPTPLLSSLPNYKLWNLYGITNRYNLRNLCPTRTHVSNISTTSQTRNKRSHLWLQTAMFAVQGGDCRPMQDERGGWSMSVNINYTGYPCFSSLFWGRTIQINFLIDTFRCIYAPGPETYMKSYCSLLFTLAASSLQTPGSCK